MEALGPMLEANLYMISWIMGRQASARLFTCSKEIGTKICNVHGQAKMYEQAAILHDITRNHPLGDYACTINIHWLCIFIHLILDRPLMSDRTFISWCPHCERTFECLLWAGVRYSYGGKLEGTGSIQSEWVAAVGDLDVEIDDGDEENDTWNVI